MQCIARTWERTLTGGDLETGCKPRDGILVVKTIVPRQLKLLNKDRINE